MKKFQWYKFRLVDARSPLFCESKVHARNEQDTLDKIVRRHFSKGQFVLLDEKARQSPYGGKIYLLRVHHAGQSFKVGVELVAMIREKNHRKKNDPFTLSFNEVSQSVFGPFSLRAHMTDKEIDETLVEEADDAYTLANRIVEKRFGKGAQFIPYFTRQDIGRVLFRGAVCQDGAVRSMHVSIEVTSQDPKLEGKPIPVQEEPSELIKAFLFNANAGNWQKEFVETKPKMPVTPKLEVRKFEPLPVKQNEMNEDLPDTMEGVPRKYHVVIRDVNRGITKERTVLQEDERSAIDQAVEKHYGTTAYFVQDSSKPRWQGVIYKKNAVEVPFAIIEVQEVAKSSSTKVKEMA